MRARPVIVRSAWMAIAVSVLLVALGAGEARGAPGWRWPVEGSVITPYSNDDANPYAAGVHRGIDIAAPVGTSVRAARAGVVTYAGALGYSGLTVAVRTVDGYATSYLHLSAIAVRRGVAIAAGARLGDVGTTGRRSKPEPHLHFGVRVAGIDHRYVDPLSLLPPLPGSRTTPPAPRTAPAPVRADPAPVPLRAAPSPRRIPSAPRPAAPAVVAPVHLPLPAARHRPQPVGHPPAAQLIPAPSRDWGRPLALAGLALFVLALLGRSAVWGARAVTRTARGRASGPARGFAALAARSLLLSRRAALPRTRAGP
jgi:Peptidase family M23